MARILLVDDDPMILRLVKMMLDRAGHEVQTAANGLDAVTRAKAWRPEVIVMDVMMPELSGYDAARLIRQHPPTAVTPIIFLTAQDTLDEKIKGFEAGADDYMTKPFEPPELLLRVEVQIKRVHAIAAAAAASVQVKKKAGYLVACFSLRGGSGVSVLATNLAVALAQIWNQPCVLLDLALVAGHSALLLNLAPKRAWSDLAHFSPGEYEPELMEDHFLTHISGVKLVASPLRSEDAERVELGHVQAALGVLRPSYDYIVADLAHDFRENTLAILDAADVILMPFAPDLASVRSAAAALGVFHTLQYPPTKLRLVLNWTFPKHGLPQANIERTLSHKIDLVIPYDPERMVRSVNLGQPLTIKDANNPVGMLLEDFAFRLSRVEDTALAPALPSAAWQRVSKRQDRAGAARS